MAGGGPARGGTSLRLNFHYVFRMRSFGAFSYGEFDRLSLFEALEAGTLNRRVMHEDIAARVTLYEAVSFGVVKPLDFTLFSYH